MDDKIEILKNRLDEASITYKEYIPEDPEYSTKLIFEIPAAREKHECLLIYREELIDQALDAEFEKYRFLKGYEGVWSKEKKSIEVEIGNVDSPSRFFFDRLNRIINKPDETEEEETEEAVTSITLPSTDGLDISIGFCSKEFGFLTGCRERGPRGRNYKRITIKINNVNTTTHDSSKDLIEKIANSIFFKLIWLLNYH